MRGPKADDLDQLLGEPVAVVGKVPASPASERALLGLIMVFNERLEQAGTLQVGHFHDRFHGAVFGELERLIRCGLTGNPVSLLRGLAAQGYTDEQELRQRLTGIFEIAGLGEDVAALADIIITTYLQRQLMGLGERLRGAAGTTKTFEETVNLARKASDEVIKLSFEQHGGQTITLREHMLGAMHKVEERRAGKAPERISTGLVNLDQLISGFEPGELILLAARPSMGKTALGLGMAVYAARTGRGGGEGERPVGVFSLEMSADQIAARLIGQAVSVSANRITQGRIDDREIMRLIEAAQELQDLGLIIDDTPSPTIAELRAKCRLLKRKHNIGLVVVDYLQLIRGGTRAAESSRVNEITEVSQGLKAIARELKIPVVALSQLSRAVEMRDNKRPQLADLRDSGSLEQDADLVLLLYREEYYLSRQLGGADKGEQTKLRADLEANKGKAEVAVAKNRRGATGVAKIRFNAELALFSD